MAGGLLDLDWESEFWVSAIDKSPAAAAHRAAVRGAASLDALLEALLAAEKDCAAAGGDLFGIDGWYGIEFLGLPVFGADPEDRTAVLSWDGGRFLMAGGSGDGPWMLAAREPEPRIRVRRGAAAGAVEVSGMFIDRIRSAESWRALDGYAEAALCMLRRLDGLSDRARTEASEQVKRLCRARGLDLPGWHAPDEALEAVALWRRRGRLRRASSPAPFRRWESAVTGGLRIWTAGTDRRRRARSAACPRTSAGWTGKRRSAAPTSGYSRTAIRCGADDRLLRRRGSVSRGTAYDAKSAQGGFFRIPGAGKRSADRHGRI